MAKSTLNIGQELHSDSIIYRIESVLGQGSFGVTYKAKAYMVMKGKFGEELVETNTPKAIKEFFMKEVNEREESGSITGMSEGGLSYNYAQKFKKEAENLASMNHPNIVKVIDFISANNTYYYVMDFIEGENLNDYLKHHKMSEEEATNIIMEVAKALQYMHKEKHMLHLDLKPGNIMRRESDGHIFLIDFGLSKHYSEEGVPETSTSVGLGTPGYAPIEQANSKNAKKFRETLDVYALGATFYKLLTGQTPPYADELVSDSNVVKDELSKFGINETLVSVVVNAMIPSVNERTQNVAEFLDSFNPNAAQSDVIAVSPETEDTILDTPEKKSSTTKKKTENKPKKEQKTRKNANPNPEKAESGSNNNSEDESSSGGCFKTILILAALCLFLLWYNDWWIFSPKEDIANETPSEQVVSNVDNSSTKTETNDAVITDDNSSVSQISSEGDSPSEFNSTSDNVIEKNGYRKNGDGTITDTKRNLMWMSKDYMSIEGHSLPNASWHKAMEWCDAMNKKKFAGYSDWRVPSVKELNTLARPASQRKIYKSFFDDAGADYFWSSNSISSSVKSYVDLNDGFATSGDAQGQRNGQTNELFKFSVRLVRNIK